jgi:hypothetical protein
MPLVKSQKKLKCLGHSSKMKINSNFCAALEETSADLVLDGAEVCQQSIIDICGSHRFGYFGEHRYLN